MSPEVAPTEIEELLRTRDKIGLTTGDIAAAFELHRNTANNILERLEGDGLVRHQELGVTDVWYLQEDDPFISNGRTRGPEPKDKTDDVVGALEQYERPFMGTAELAEELGYDSNPGVTPHLERALEAGRIEKTSISGYNIWYLPEIEAGGG